MKKIFFYLFLYLVFLQTNSFAVVPELELMIRLKQEGRTYLDPFPELIPFFEENAKKIEERITQHNQEELTNFYKEVHDFFISDFEKHGITLPFYYFYHKICSGLLDEIYVNEIYFTRDECRQVLQNLRGYYFEGKRDESPKVFACLGISGELNLKCFEKNIWPFPSLHNNGVYDIEDLNKSYAEAIPLFGLPLFPAYADGSIHTPYYFFDHDHFHSQISDLRDYKCEVDKNYVATEFLYKGAAFLYNLIDKGSKEEQFVVFTKVYQRSASFF